MHNQLTKHHVVLWVSRGAFRVSVAFPVAVKAKIKVILAGTTVCSHKRWSALIVSLCEVVGMHTCKETAYLDTTHITPYLGLLCRAHPKKP